MIHRNYLVLLVLLKALQLQGSFGLLNEFLLFGPVSDAALQFVIFIFAVTFYIILRPVFRSSQ